MTLPEAKAGRDLPNRTSGERDANQPQVRDQTGRAFSDATNTLNSGEAGRFPIEHGHVLAFSRALGAEPPPDGGVPLTFPIAYAHFDPDWPLVMKPGQPWHGSGAEPGVKKGGGGLHAEQEFEYFRPLKVGETLTVHKRPGRTWTKEGRSGVLDFTERHTDFHDAAGELVARATTVTVVKRTEKAGRVLPNRTSGERDANQPQVRDQTAPSSANATNTLNSGEAEL